MRRSIGNRPVPAMLLASLLMGSCADNPRRVEKASFPAGELGARLGVPRPGEPWRMRGRRWGFRFDFVLPDDRRKLTTLAPDLRPRLEQKVVFRERNLRTLAKSSREVEALLASTTLRQVPEYERTAATVVLSLHPTDGEMPDPLHRHETVLARLPSYTRLHVFSPGSLAVSVRDRLRELKWGERSTVHAVSTGAGVEGGIVLRRTTTRWAQDLLEVASGADGADYVVAPVTRYQIEDLSRPDNDYLQQLAAGGRRRIRVPLFWRGGNVLIGESDRRVLFVGGREIENNRRDWYNGVFTLPAQDVVNELLLKLTGADELRVVPNSRHLFHLDLVTCFLRRGVAALIDPLDMESVAGEDRQVIARTEAELKAAGFRIVRIPTLAARIAAYQSPVNLVPFTHRDDGKHYALVPRYPDCRVEHGGTKGSLNEWIERRYEQEGIEVLAIEERFHPERGNTHCAVCVLD